MLILDGSQGEGGGQILRTALALSTLTGIPFELKNIRARRPQPGIKAQHLQCLNAYTQLTRAHHTPAKIGGKSISFFPGKVIGGTITLDVGTAGNLPLLVQSLLPALIFSPKPVLLFMRGGTDTAWAPLWDTMEATLFPHLRQIGR